MKWILLSIWIFIGSLNYLWTDVYPVWKVRTSGINTEGIIREVYLIESRTGDVEGARLTIEFTDSSGNPYSFVGVQEGYSRFNDTPGSKIAIRYLPDNPRQAMTVTQAEAPLSQPLAFGIGFLALSVWLCFYGIKSRREL